MYRGLVVKSALFFGQICNCFVLLKKLSNLHLFCWGFFSPTQGAKVILHQNILLTIKRKKVQIWQKKHFHEWVALDPNPYPDFRVWCHTLFSGNHTLVWFYVKIFKITVREGFKKNNLEFSRFSGLVGLKISIFQIKKKCSQNA